MRGMLLLVLSTTACLAAPPLPEIKTGTREKEIWISETRWRPGSLAASAAFIVGEVTGASSDVQTTAQQIWMSETCSLLVEQAWGVMNDIQGIKQARLTHAEEASPYVPVEPDWGRLRHLQKGQKVLVFLHEHEGGPCFGSEAVIELTETTQALPDILRRTAFQPSQFTDAELLVVKAASPVLHAELANFRNGLHMLTEEEADERRLVPGMPLVLSATFGAAVLVILWLRRRSLRQ